MIRCSNHPSASAVHRNPPTTTTTNIYLYILLSNPCRVDFDKFSELCATLRRRARQNEMDKQSTVFFPFPSLPFLLKTLRIPQMQSDHMSISPITAGGATTPSSSSFFCISCFPAVVICTVFYIMRRRNRLVLVPMSSVTGGSIRQRGHISTTSHNNPLISRTSAHLRWRTLHGM